MSDYSVTVVFEVRKPKRATLQSWEEFNPALGNAEKTVVRILGRSIHDARPIQDIWRHGFPEALDARLIAAKLLRLRGANSLLSLTFQLGSEELEIADSLRRASSREILAISNKLNLALKSEHYIYGVTVSCSANTLGLESAVVDTWIHFGLQRDNLFFSTQVQEELAIRVGVERALTVSALVEPSNVLVRWIRRPLVAYRLRGWAVELLIDKQSIQEAFRSLRVAMNLDRLRNEILENARTWYVSVGTSLTLLSALLTLIALFYMP